MTVPRMTRRMARQVGSTSTDYTTAFVTPWMLVVGATTFRVSDEARGVSGGYRHKVRWRTADILAGLPGAWTDSTNVRTSDGISSEDFTISTGKLWVQAGLAVSSSTGAGEAYAAIQASCSSKGQIVGSARIQVEPTLNSSQVAYYPIPGVSGQLGVTGLLFAFRATGVGGTLDFTAAARTFDSQDAPGSWVDWSGTPFSLTADGVCSTGLFTATDSGKMFAQGGLKVTSAGRGTIDVVVACVF